MRFKDKLYIARKNIKRKSSKKQFIALITISSLIVIIAFSFTRTLTSYLYDGVMQDISYRSFFVTYDFDNDIGYDNMIARIKQSKYVSDAFVDNSSMVLVHSNTFNKTTDDMVTLYAVSETNLPNIAMGRAFVSENEIVCPRWFYPSSNLEESSNLSRDELINMEEYLNKEIEIYYNVVKWEDDMTLVVQDTIVEPLTVVGIYENNASLIDENICYGKLDLLEKIYEDQSQYSDNSGYSSIKVVATSVADIDLLKEDLAKMGIILQIL